MDSARLVLLLPGARVKGKGVVFPKWTNRRACTGCMPVLVTPQHAALPPSFGGRLGPSLCCCAGVDPQLAVYQRLPPDLQLGGKQQSWALLSAKRTHSHDVRALCVAAGRALPDGPRLWSGGNDTQLYNHSVAAYLKASRRAPPGACCFSLAGVLGLLSGPGAALLRGEGVCC